MGSVCDRVVVTDREVVEVELTEDAKRHGFGMGAICALAERLGQHAGKVVVSNPLPTSNPLRTSSLTRARRRSYTIVIALHHATEHQGS